MQVNAFGHYLLTDELMPLLRASNDARIVNSIYYDDDANSSVSDNISGISKRQKFRVRWYGSDIAEKPTLEIKTRVNKTSILQKGSWGLQVRVLIDFETSIFIDFIWSGFSFTSLDLTGAIKVIV